MMNDASAKMIVAALRTLMEANGWTQAEAAARMGISQGHLSKVLRDRHRPGRQLQLAIRKAAPAGGAISEAWLAHVAKAAEASADFRAAVDAILKLCVNMHEAGH